MAISSMITELRNESVSIANLLRPKQEEATKIRERLTVLDAEIHSLSDQFDAIRMAIDALELVCVNASREPAPEPVAEPELPRTVDRHHSRVPKKIGKYDPKGRKIGEFPSVNQAAQQHGWSNHAMKKYIEETPRDKQIRIRGYYLDYVA